MRSQRSTDIPGHHSIAPVRTGPNCAVHLVPLPPASIRPLMSHCPRRRVNGPQINVACVSDSRKSLIGDFLLTLSFSLRSSLNDIREPCRQRPSKPHFRRSCKLCHGHPTDGPESCSITTSDRVTAGETPYRVLCQTGLEVDLARTRHVSTISAFLLIASLIPRYLDGSEPPHSSCPPIAHLLLSTHITMLSGSYHCTANDHRLRPRVPLHSAVPCYSHELSRNHSLRSILLVGACVPHRLLKQFRPTVVEEEDTAGELVAMLNTTDATRTKVLS